MAGYITLDERKRAKVAAMIAALDELIVALKAYARAHGGRLVVYGSAARGALRFDSDVDILVDFPLALESEAWRFAERECFARDLTPDIHLAAWCTPAFLDRTFAEGRVLE